MMLFVRGYDFCAIWFNIIGILGSTGNGEEGEEEEGEAVFIVCYLLYHSTHELLVKYSNLEIQI